MTARKKHRVLKPRGRWQHVYSGRDLLGVVAEQPDGTWEAIKLGVVIGRHATRQQAIDALGDEPEAAS